LIATRRTRYVRPDFRPLTLAVTATSPVAEPASPAPALEPSVEDESPYWKEYVVSAPEGFTVPLNVAVAEPMVETCPVTAEGADPGVVVVVGAADVVVVVAALGAGVVVVVGDAVLVDVGAVVGVDVVDVGVVDVVVVVVAGPDAPVGPAAASSTVFRLTSCDPVVVCPLGVEPVPLPTAAVAPLPAVDVAAADGSAPLEADDVDTEGGHASASSSASCLLAAESADLSAANCSFPELTWDWAFSRLTAFEALCASVSPASAVESVLWACSRLAWADWSATSADDGSSFARTCPAFT
jgi:hypothetical protein